MNTFFLEKRRLAMIVVTVLMAGLVSFLCLNPRGAPRPADGLASAIPPKAERLKMSRLARIQLLERFGQVPEDADISDWQLAEHTSWWGKPIDPRTFWTGRVVRLDEATRSAANRCGRLYPPIPFEDKSLPEYRDDEGIDWNSDTIDSGPSLHFARSSKERAFWERSLKNAPKTAASIEQQQLEAAERTMVAREEYGKKSGVSSSKATGASGRFEVTAMRRAVELGYPQEAFTEDAIFWTYVLVRRRDYNELVALKVPREQPAVTGFLDRLVVDSKYITEPLTAVQLKAANAWKLAYLQRLRREKTDESYINAYLKAWNLSRDEVFGESQK